MDRDFDNRDAMTYDEIDEIEASDYDDLRSWLTGLPKRPGTRRADTFGL